MDSGVLDLTFLTETERNLILQVLNRDDEIQKREDERIARLKSKAARTNNPVIQKKIKMRTGAWFFDLMQPTKAKTKSGRDTIRASIRKSNVRGFRQTRSPAPPPPAPFRVDVIVEEPAKDQYSTHTDPEPQDRTIPYAVETETQVEYVEDTPYPDYSADDRPSYGEMDDSYSSDLNRDSASVSTAHEDHMEGTLSEKTQEIDTTSEDQQTESSSSTSTAANVVITSIDSGAQKDVDETPDLPENYVYLELTPDEPEEEKSGKLKRTGSIRRKSTKRDKDRDPSTHEVNVEDHSVALKENTEHLSQEKAYPMQESVVPQDIPLDQTSSVATEVIIPANESQSNLDSEYSVAFTPHLDDDNQHHHQAVGVIDTVTLPDDVIDLTGDATTAYDDATLSPSDHTAPVEDLTSPAEDVTYHSTTTPEIIVSTTPGAQDGEHPDQDDDVSKSFRSDFELPVLETTDKDYEEDRDKVEELSSAMSFLQTLENHDDGNVSDAASHPGNSICGDILACIAPSVTSDCLIYGHKRNLELCNLSSQSSILQEIMLMLTCVHANKAAVYRETTCSGSCLLTMKQVPSGDTKNVHKNCDCTPAVRQRVSKSMSLESVVKSLTKPADVEVDRQPQIGPHDDIIGWPTYEIDPRVIEAMVKRETRVTSGIKPFRR